MKIRVNLSTRQALLDIGRKGESYDDVIRRLILLGVKHGDVHPNVKKGLLDIEEEASG